ncbi:MAG TPA: NIL domain-containing protein [Bacteroidaceae bacterium]|nr:NIL domain-containing protein [Bacteroidaceae bacterium]
MVKKLILTFPGESIERPFTYELIKKFDIRINILKANIEAGKTGKLLVEFDADVESINKAIEYLEANGVDISLLSSKISYNSTLCINCGACAAACPPHALTITSPDWKLVFDKDKCIMCKLCLTSCPLNLFKIEFTE